MIPIAALMLPLIIREWLARSRVVQPASRDAE
jgi:hypothetical protein